jgi:transposase-like protein
VEEVARLGAQLLMRAALEAEVTEFLGRDRYQRAATTAQARPGSRNGFRPVTVTTTAGPVTLERPKLRGTTAAFASRLFGKHVTKTNALESLVIASLVPGLSATYPAAMKILLTDAAGLTSSLRFPGEASCISLVWAVLDRASAGWRGLSMTPAGLRHLHDLRRHVLDPPRQLPPLPATAPDPDDQPDPVTAPG